MSDSPSDSYDHGSGVGPDPGPNINRRNPPSWMVEGAIDALNRPKPADKTNQFFSWPSGESLPGMGTPYDDCATLLDFVCESCGDVVPGSRRCRRSKCSECWESWVMKTTTSVGSRLLAMRARDDARSDNHVRLHHCVLSPPPKMTFASEEPEERLIEAGRDFMHTLDVAGTIHYHPWRIRNDDHEHDLENDPMDNLGEWKKILGEADSIDELKQDLVLSPHLHLFIVADFVPGDEFTNSVWDETGWIWKRITQRESKSSLYGNEDLAAVLSYNLSHTEIYQDSNGDHRARYRYVGPNRAWDDVHVREAYRKEFNATVREVAARTLGVPTRETTCLTETTSPANLQVDVGRAQARAIDNSSSDDDLAGAGRTDLPEANNDDVTGEVQVGAGNTGTGTGTGTGTDDGKALLPDDPGSRVELEEPEPCHGRLLPPWKMADKVVDDDWLAQADYPARAREAVLNFYATEEGPPD